MKSVLVFNYNITKSVYENAYRIPVLPDDSEDMISEVMISDLDNDGNTDIICLVAKHGNITTLRFKFIFQEENGFGDDSVKNIITIESFFKHHPQLFQVYDEEIGELRTMLIYQKMEDERKILSFSRDDDGTVDYEEKHFKSIVSQRMGCKSFDFVRFNKMSDKHAGAFIDLNMDCRPDLVIESIGEEGRVLEIYFYTGEGFCLVDLNPVPSDFSSPAFFNINADGSNDILFVSGKLEIFIFFNKYHLVEKSARRQFCRKMKDRETERPFTNFKDDSDQKVRNTKLKIQ